LEAVITYTSSSQAAAPKTAPTPARAAGAIALAGFAAGLCDFLYASGMALSKGGSPLEPWRGVAGVLIGSPAREGGIDMAFLGVATHFFITFVAAAMLYLIMARVAWFSARPLITGVLFGIGVLLVMNYVVLPLSRVGRPIYPVETLHIMAFWHIVLVGLPTSFVIARGLKDKPQH